MISRDATEDHDTCTTLGLDCLLVSFVLFVVLFLVVLCFCQVHAERRNTQQVLFAFQAGRGQARIALTKGRRR